MFPRLRAGLLASSGFFRSTREESENLHRKSMPLLTVSAFRRCAACCRESGTQRILRTLSRIRNARRLISALSLQYPILRPNSSLCLPDTHTPRAPTCAPIAPPSHTEPKEALDDICPREICADIQEYSAAYRGPQDPPTQTAPWDGSVPT